MIELRGGPCQRARHDANTVMSPETPYPKSVFARNLTDEAGITELMDDLGEALTLGRGKIRLGNPSL